MFKATTIARRSLTLFALTAALGAAACSTQVIGGGADGGGGAVGGSGGATTVTGTSHAGDGGAGGAPTAPNAVAEWAYTLPGTPEPSGSSSSGGGGGVDPNTLFVRIGNYGVQCFDTPPYSCEGTTWQVQIGLPPAMQAPGVYSLADTANSFFSVTGSNGTADDCWGGGGSFTDGTVEVVSNDGSTIVVKLSGTNPVVDEVSTDGQYAAPICGGAL